MVLFKLLKLNKHRLRSQQMKLTKCNTMQKIINVLAVLSFAGVVGIVGGGTYVYLQKDALIKELTDVLAGGAIGAIS